MTGAAAEGPGARRDPPAGPAALPAAAAPPAAARERVLVALTGSAADEVLLRRAARLAAGPGADLLGVYVRVLDGAARGRPGPLEAQRALLEELGGTLAEIAGVDAPSALLGFAAAENVTQIVLAGGGRVRGPRSYLQALFVRAVLNRAKGVDVHVVPVSGTAQRPLPAAPPRRGRVAVSAWRSRGAWLLGTLGVVGLAAAAVPLHGSLGLPGALLCLLLVVALVARLGGLRPAVAATAVGTVSADFFLTSPRYSLVMTDPVELLAVLVFLAVAGIISTLIDRLARRGMQVARATAEAEALARLAGESVVAGPHTLRDLVVELRRTFDADCVAVLQPAPDGPGWTVSAQAGGPAPERPEQARYSAALDQGAVLTLTGRPLSADDTALLGPFVSQMRLAQERHRLQGEATRADELAEVDALRTALLDAVSHDLRTPLAGIKAAVTSLLTPGADWNAQAVTRFHRTIDREADRLGSLVSNLLDLSRLRAGTLPATLRSTDLEKTACRAVDSLADTGAPVDLDLPEDLPPVRADPGLLERALANVLANARAVTPPGALVTVQAEPIGADRLELRVIDAGPGVAPERRESVFQPFQRFGDAAAGTRGLGLGLAIAKGFTEAMGGRLTVRDAPGGGAVFAFDLERAEPS
jgi:two-component system, OmpR family, sensor histidine kinase KdpD